MEVPIAEQGSLYYLIKLKYYQRMFMHKLINQPHLGSKYKN